MVKIIKHLVSSRITENVSYGSGNKKKYITVHETDNTKATADAEAHGNLQANGNSRLASWHYTVDDKEAVQSFSHSIRCWAAGTDKGNNESIQVEICVNSDGNYKKAVENAAELVAYIAKKEGIPLANVVQHNHWSGKNCPSKMRSGKAHYTWSSFKRLVKSHMEVGEKQKVEARNKPQRITKKYTSLVDYLKAHKKPSGFSDRVVLAKKYKIKNYTGTAEQNTKILDKLQG